jgi:hypothetical protein
MVGRVYYRKGVTGMPFLSAPFFVPVFSQTTCARWGPPIAGGWFATIAAVF